MNKDEKVFVFNRNIIDDIGSFQGLNYNYKPYLEIIFNKKNVYTEFRSKAENDFSKKQIIPYVIIMQAGKILCYVRGTDSREKRLVANASIGIGGHIKQEDDSIFFYSKSNHIEKIYEAAKIREVQEEIIIDSDYSEKLVGILNDDSNEVGRVHFGIVYVWFLDKPNVRKNERKITKPVFLTPEELLSKKYRLENWSQICLNSIDSILKLEVK